MVTIFWNDVAPWMVAVGITLIGMRLGSLMRRDREHLAICERPECPDESHKRGD